MGSPLAAPLRPSTLPNQTRNSLSWAPWFSSPASDQQGWANKLLEKLLPEISDVNRVVMFAGHRYREFLTAPLEQRGIKVEASLAHLKRGQQLRWLSEH
ncbi:MAG: DUF6884 domain-containing protein [Xanthobacteraceae bacterium]